MFQDLLAENPAFYNGTFNFGGLNVLWRNRWGDKVEALAKWH